MTEGSIEVKGEQEGTTLQSSYCRPPYHGGPDKTAVAVAAHYR